MNEVYIGYSNDSNIRYRSSSGGIITAIVKSLFESDDIGTFLGCYFDTSDCCYKPRFIHSFKEYDLVGSVYQDMDIVGFLKKNISDVKGRLMVVCSPCLVKVIRHIAKIHSVDVFVASYFCSGQTTIEGTYFYYKSLGIDKSNVKNIRYRGNGWPNGIEIQLKDGTVIKHPNYTEPWITIHRSRLFTPRRCFLCKQVESIAADISVGDPWLKEYLSEDKIGNSIFLVHTELGLEVIYRMISNHCITCNQVDYNVYIKSQKPSVIRKNNIKEDKDFIDFELNIQNKSRCYKWATKNFSNVKKYVWIMGHVIRPYFNAKKMNKKMIVIKLINKVVRKLKMEGKMLLE